MALISLADLKTFLGVADTSQDTLLNLLIAQCSARVETFCRRTFTSTSYTEYLEGNATNLLPLTQYPVTAIASLYLDETAWWGTAPGAFASATLLVEGTDFVRIPDNSGLVMRINGGWPKPRLYSPGTINALNLAGVGNIKVTYTAGFASIPADLQQAVMFLCSMVRARAPTGMPVTSESWEDWSQTLTPLVASAFSALPPDTLDVLRSYRRVSIG